MKEMEGLEGKLANIGGKQTKNGTEKDTKSEEDISSVEKTGAEGSSLKEEGEKNNSEEIEDGIEEVENSENSEEKTQGESQKTDEKEESSVIGDIKINHSIKQAVKTGPDGEISVYPLGVKAIQNDGQHPLAPSSVEIENVSRIKNKCANLARKIGTKRPRVVVN